MIISPVVIALLGFLVAACSALLAGGIAWGVFRAQLEHQQKKIDLLSDEVKALNTTVQVLTTKVAVISDRHERESRVTPHP